MVVCDTITPHRSRPQIERRGDAGLVGGLFGGEAPLTTHPLWYNPSITTRSPQGGRTHGIYY
jgi:hypothetical protein